MEIQLIVEWGGGVPWDIHYFNSWRSVDIVSLIQTTVHEDGHQHARNGCSAMMQCKVTDKE